MCFVCIIILIIFICGNWTTFDMMSCRLPKLGSTIKYFFYYSNRHFCWQNIFTTGAIQLPMFRKRSINVTKLSRRMIPSVRSALILCGPSYKIPATNVISFNCFNIRSKNDTDIDFYHIVKTFRYRKFYILFYMSLN